MIEKQTVIDNLMMVYDPEVSVNIYDLGLIYNIDITEEDNVSITMTLTSPFCPAGDDIVNDVVAACYNSGAKDVNVDITFQPEWGPDKISDEGKLELGIF